MLALLLAWGVSSAAELSLVAPRPAHAETLPARGPANEAEQAAFALILGVNKSVDPDLPVLRYADDDAVRYRELFGLLGARTHLLTRLDENTRRLVGEGAEPAPLPRRLDLSEEVASIGLEVAAAHARGQRAVFYFVYAGHGNVESSSAGARAPAGEQGYLALEDSRLTVQEIEKAILDRIGADESHLIVDACYSYFLAYGRGPGGKRRELHGFVPSAGLAQRADVGLLLSTTSARQSHEWEGFQAGVFSHEVRSGLFGAADFDGDGRISYREMAAFVGRANAAIVNETFRPTVFSHPPKNNGDLLDLRHRATRALLMDGAAPEAHYLLEDTRGVRLADFHNAPGHPTTILLPAPSVLYLRRLSDDREMVIAAGTSDVRLSDLRPSAPRVAVRGAAHDAFNLIFSLPFDEQAWKTAATSETSFEELLQAAAAADDAEAGTRQDGPMVSRSTKRALGWTAAGVGAASALFGAGMFWWAHRVSDGAANQALSSNKVEKENARVRELNAWGAAGLTTATICSFATGWLFWIADRDLQIAGQVKGDGAGLALRGRF